MSRKWTFRLCVPLASAAVLVGCTQEVGDDQTQNRTAIDNATNQQKQKMQIAVTGCLGTGPGTNQFVLTQVRLAPLSSQPTDALTSANLTLPQNSAVRLALNEGEEVSTLVGQTVSVTGLLIHDGRDTIGTAGPPAAAQSARESRTDRSEAASDQHYSDKVRKEAGPIGQDSMNNGTYPEMRVQQISATRERCNTSPQH